MSAPSIPVLPAPAPLDKPPGLFAFLRGMTSDPMTLWTRQHFEAPVVRRITLIGPMMTVSDPATIRHVFVDNAGNYRKDWLQQRLIRPLLGDGILAAEGAEWRRLRRITAPLFVPRRVDGHARAMDETARATAAAWAVAHDGQVVSVGEAMAQLTLRVLDRTLFADALSSHGPAITTAVTRYLETAGRIDLLDLLSVPDWVPRPRRRRVREAMATLSGVVDGIVADRRQRVDGPDAGDLTDALLRARDPDTGEGLGDREIRATLLTFLAAGHETTANALSWTLMLLALHPAEADACRREVDLADGRGLAGAELVEALPYARAVIEEAMRLYPPASLITREALADDETPSGPIVKGTLVVLSPWVLHRHRRLWQEPERFRPERFLPENRAAIPRFAYLPFGAGPRVCIGSAFAMQEAVLALAAVLRSARLELAPGTRLPMPVQSITLRPDNGLPMRVTARR